jgi:hypothetical protein
VCRQRKREQERERVNKNTLLWKLRGLKMRSWQAGDPEQLICGSSKCKDLSNRKIAKESSSLKTDRLGIQKKKKKRMFLFESL